MMVRRKKVEGLKQVRCAIYTRISVDDEHGGNGFDSIDAQREAAEAYITSQKNEGWVCLPTRYEDRGISGATSDRPSLQQLLADVEAGMVDCIVVQRVDRLSRSLLDFARIVAVLEKHDCAFVSVTQRFDTSESMGRLTLNMLLSFAQFEREMIAERTRDKMHAARRKGRWIGGTPILGYDVAPEGGQLVVNEGEAERVRNIFGLYLKHGSLIPTVQALNARGWTNKRWVSKKGVERGGCAFMKNTLHGLLTNVTYTGHVKFQGELFDGEHDAIIDTNLWECVQRRLKLNGHNGAKRQRNKYGALLRGILWCAPCDKPMYHHYAQKGSRRYRYYRCTNTEKRGTATCPSGSLPAPEIERFVVDELRCIGRDEAVVAATLKAVRAETNDPIAEADLRAALASFSPLWNELTGVERAKLVRLLVDRVAYDSTAGTVALTFKSSGIKALAGETA